MIKIELPYPPSVNHYWRHAGRHVYISRDGRIYRERVAACVLAHGIHGEALTGHISLTISIYPPDRRRRDIDNVLKSLLDAMQHARIYDDDSQIVKIEIAKKEPVAGGKVVVYVEEITM